MPCHMGRGGLTATRCGRGDTESRPSRVHESKGSTPDTVWEAA
jgi:hypothetical protein